MASKKEEERNERIIRGLMKLPPNRKCINCNSLGPQYVCTNFWTFVCVTCSGIHREFTHRVKSVSMAKFTSQEVEALQNGGNQRAREMYLKDWDTQRQRLPDSSNANKVRDFIKSVYVDRKYAGGKSSDKPPRDGQSLISPEEDTRRASSYHSYSQSPPYDSQYEDRRYGKQSAVLTRKPGSDRGLDGKVSRWFSNDGSGSRVSDYSVSSGGTQSPNYQKDLGFSSPPIQRPRHMSSEDVLPQSIYSFSEANTKRAPDGIPRPQRTASFGSFGSFDSNSPPLSSFNSSSFVDVSESQQNPGAFQDKVSSFTRPSVPGGPSDIDLFKAPVLQEPVSSGTSPVDLFQLPATSSAPVDLFQPSLICQAQPVNNFQPPQTSHPSSLDFFALQQSAGSAAATNTISVELSIPKDDGWATFDAHPAASLSATENLAVAKFAHRDKGESGQFDPFPSFDMGTQWPSFQHSGVHESSSMSNPWHEGIDSVQAPAATTRTESWNAFEDSGGYLPLKVVEQSNEQVAGLNPSSATDQYLNDIDKDGIQRAASYDQYMNSVDKYGIEMAAPYRGPGISLVQSHVTGPSYVLEGGTLPQAADHKSTNPFDNLFESELEQNNMFLDMSSLQAALPNAQLPPTFLGGTTESWFPENPVTPFVPTVAQGGLAYIAAQAPNSPIRNVPTHGPVASSIGGNPFA